MNLQNNLEKAERMQRQSHTLKHWLTDSNSTGHQAGNEVRFRFERIIRDLSDDLLLESYEIKQQLEDLAVPLFICRDA